jgi:U3 small nucleolar RNA-associated protein 10
MVTSSLTAFKKKIESSCWRTLISFYCSTLIGYINRIVITNDVVTLLLPFILKGLKSHNVDYRGSSYMIVGLLASKTTFDSKLTSSLINSIIKNFGPNLKEEAALCLVILLSTSESSFALSNKNVKYIMSKWDQFITVVEGISREYDVSRLMEALLKSQHLKEYPSVEAEKSIEHILQLYHDKDTTTAALVLSGSSHDEFLSNSGGSLADTHSLLSNLLALSSTDVWTSSETSPHSIDMLQYASVEFVTDLARGLVTMETNQLNSKIHQLMDPVKLSWTTINDRLYHFIVVGVIGVAMETKDHTHHMSLAFLLVKYMRDHYHHLTDHISSVVTIPDLADIFDSLKEKHIMERVIDSCHANLLVWLISHLLDHIPIDSNQSLWLHPPLLSDVSHDTIISGSLHSYMYLSLLDALTSSTPCSTPTTDASITSCLLQKVYSNCGVLNRFLAMIWLAPLPSYPLISQSLQLNSLQIALSNFQSLSSETAVELLSSYCPVLPSLLVPLANADDSIRCVAYQCMTSLHQAASCHPSVNEIYLVTPFLQLLGYLVQFKVELLADSEGLGMILERLYQNNGEDLPVLSLETSSSKRRKSLKKAEVEGRGAMLEGIIESLLTVTVAMETPPSHMQYQMLRILKGVDHKNKVLNIINLLKDYLQKFNNNEDEHLSSIDVSIFQLLVECFTPAIGSLFTKLSDVYEMFMSLFDYTNPLGLHSPSPAHLTINQIIPEFYNSLSPDHQLVILKKIIDLIVQSKGISVAAKDCLHQLPLATASLLSEFKQCLDCLVQPTVEHEATPRKRRKKVAKQLAESATPLLSWKRVMVMLEVVGLDHGDECHSLAPILFSLLKSSCESNECDDSEINREYIKQLLLSALLKICTKLGKLGKSEAQKLLPEGQFNVELIVRCLRYSGNPHTHRISLLLLSSAAKLFPTRIVHNLMSIFTFMGSNLLHQDDSYTFEVIQKTLTTIIPIIIQHSSPSGGSSSRRRSLSGLSLSVIEILRIFVDAVPHVPSHRQVLLLSNLINIIGSNEHLYIVVGLLTEKYVVQICNEGSTNERLTIGGHRDGAAALEFHLLTSLCQEFPVEVQLVTILKLLEYIEELPSVKPLPNQLHRMTQHVTFIFNVGLHSDQQLHQFRFSILSLAVSILAKMKSNNGESNINIDSVMSIFQQSLLYVNILNKYRASTSTNGMIKLWDSMINKVHSIIEKVVCLLSDVDFLTVLLELTMNEEVRSKSLNILSKKLKDSQWNITTELEVILLEFVAVIVNIPLPSSIPPHHKMSFIHQRALHTLKLIINRIGPNHVDRFIDVIKSLVIAIKEVDCLTPDVQSAALMCVAESCLCLTTHFIPLIPDVLPWILDHIDKTQNEALQTSAVYTLRVLLQTLSKYVSLYVESILVKVCQNELIVFEKQTELKNETSKLREHISIGIPSLVLLPAFSKSLPVVMEFGQLNVLCFIEMFKRFIQHLNKEDINRKSLMEIFMELFGYRINHDDMSPELIFEVEEHVNDAFCELIVKLSEKHFRPLFLKLIDWSVKGNNDRTITFYHLTRNIARKLKSLFLLFADHTVDNAVSVLQSCHSSAGELVASLSLSSLQCSGSLPFKGSPCAGGVSKAILCLELLLDTLRICFLHDDKGSFVTGERFDQLMKPLVDQVRYNEWLSSCDLHDDEYGMNTLQLVTSQITGY